MPTTPDTLRQFPFLRPLADDQLKWLARSARELDLPPRSVIFRDGDPGDAVYLLAEGQVDIFKRTEEGEAPVNLLHPPDMFGEMSLLDDQPRSASARALTRVSLIVIPKKAFVTLVRREPRLLYGTALVSDERLRQRDVVWVRELETHNRQLRQLYETSLDITRHLDLQSALTAIVQRASQLLESTDGQLCLFNPEQNVLTIKVPVSAGRAFVRPGKGCTGRAFSTGEPVIDNQARRSRRELAAPIQLETQALGTLTVYRARQQTPFTSEDARLLLLLANQAAIAIENARLFALALEKGRLDGELQVAHEVQRSLIPIHVPRVRGAQFAGLWRPAREVSGDFYDYIPLENNRWGMVIADVSDKGIPAAVFMAAARSIIRANLLADANLTRAAARANRLITSDASRGMFVTVFVGIFDPRTRQVEYINAGHNPPVLVRARTKQLERLDNHCLAFGIDAEETYGAYETQLEDRDVLVLYTDGITEAVNQDDELFGEARLVEVIKNAARLPARGHAAYKVVHAIDDAVTEFTGARPLADDVTLVVLSVQSK